MKGDWICQRDVIILRQRWHNVFLNGNRDGIDVRKLPSHMEKTSKSWTSHGNNADSITEVR